MRRFLSIRQPCRLLKAPFSSTPFTRQGMIQNRRLLEDLVKRRFIYGPAFEIYNGCGGLYDYGPVGAAIKNNVEQHWRNHFVVEEDMLEVNATCLTPRSVLEASGHISKFTDLLVKDTKTGVCYRADKLLVEFVQEKLTNQKKKPLEQGQRQTLEGLLREADGMTQEQMRAAFQRLRIVAPQTGNELSSPEPFNLMFKTAIGPQGAIEGYLRPETAQGIFVNFAKLLEYNGGRMPFAAAQIGLGFRNQISPRNGLLRVRQFQMAEIEHFVDPQDKSHGKFDSHSTVMLPLMSHQHSQATWIQAGAALRSGIIANQTLAYYLARTMLFLRQVGINSSMVRFRQLSPTERAHYAADCWDVEIDSSFGWIECVSCADRSAYDLERHREFSGAKLFASRKLASPRPTPTIELVLNKPQLGKLYRKDLQKLQKYVQALTAEDMTRLKEEFQLANWLVMQVDETQFSLNPQLLSFEEKVVNVGEEKYVPHVIEPSFGLGRIIHCLLEHSFRVRDQKRTYLRLPAKIAPVKVSVLPVISSPEFEAAQRDIVLQLKRRGITTKTDNSSQSIGKRYARMDEIGVPFAVTLDEQTLRDGTVTIREADTTKQVRLPRAEVASIIDQLSHETLSWSVVQERYPAVQQAE